MRVAAVNGASSFLVEMTSGIVVFLFNRQLLSYVGDLGVVVYGIVSNSALIASSIFNGISQAAQPVMAMNFGAGKHSRVEDTRRMALKTAAAAGVLFTAIGLFCPEMLVYAFVEPTEELWPWELRQSAFISCPSWRRDPTFCSPPTSSLC